MRIPLLHTRWFPLLACVLVAEANFWWWASTGGNEADYAGIALFAFCGVYYAAGAIARREPHAIVSAAGALAALALMVLRETGRFDRGYLPPYAVFAAAVLAGHALDRGSRSRSRPTGA